MCLRVKYFKSCEELATFVDRHNIQKERVQYIGLATPDLRSLNVKWILMYWELKMGN